MYTNGQILRNVTTAARADLRRAVGVHLHESSTSIRGFVFDHGDEPRPSCIGYALGNVTAGEAPDIQVLDRDEAKPLHDLGRLLVVEVPALVCRVLVQASDLARQLAVLVASPVATGPAALQGSQLLLFHSEPARIVYPFAGRQRC